MPSFDEFFFLFVFLGEEVEEEINDDEDMLDGNPDDDEEEEEMSPMQIPNPFLGLSPQSITNAALALAAKANSNSNNQAVSLDEERKQRQQLLQLGGETFFYAWTKKLYCFPLLHDYFAKIYFVRLFIFTS